MCGSCLHVWNQAPTGVFAQLCRKRLCNVQNVLCIHIHICVRLGVHVHSAARFLSPPAVTLFQSAFRDSQLRTSGEGFLFFWGEEVHSHSSLSFFLYSLNRSNVISVNRKEERTENKAAKGNRQDNNARGVLLSGTSRVSLKLIRRHAHTTPTTTKTATAPNSPNCTTHTCICRGLCSGRIRRCFHSTHSPCSSCLKTRAGKPRSHKQTNKQTNNKRLNAILNKTQKKRKCENRPSTAQT
jgi:hypothetical protein